MFVCSCELWSNAQRIVVCHVFIPTEGVDNKIEDRYVQTLWWCNSMWSSFWLENPNLGDWSHQTSVCEVLVDEGWVWWWWRQRQ